MSFKYVRTVTLQRGEAPRCILLCVFGQPLVVTAGFCVKCPDKLSPSADYAEQREFLSLLSPVCRSAEQSERKVDAVIGGEKKIGPDWLDWLIFYHEC